MFIRAAVAALLIATLENEHFSHFRRRAIRSFRTLWAACAFTAVSERCAGKATFVPRYFFNVNDQLDDIGREFPALAQAKCEAVRFAGQMICDAAGNFWDSADLELIVTNEKGLMLFTLRFFGTEAPAVRASR